MINDTFGELILKRIMQIASQFMVKLKDFMRQIDVVKIGKNSSLVDGLKFD